MRAVRTPVGIVVRGCSPTTTPREGLSTILSAAGVRPNANQQFLDLALRDPSEKLDPSYLVRVQPFGECAQQLMPTFGCDPINHQLVASHPHRKDLSLSEQRRETLEQSLLRQGERRMPARVHCASLNRDRQVD